MKKLLKSLSETDHQLVRETKKDHLYSLDEDDLIELHSRIRKARNKHTKVYRRAAATAVTDKKSRGAGRRTTGKNAARVEVFEDALARVSRRLAVVARRNAEELKRERILAAAGTEPTSFAGPDHDNPAAARLPGAAKSGKAGARQNQSRRHLDSRSGARPR